MHRGAIYRELKRMEDPVKRKVLKGFFKTGKGQYSEGDKFLGVPVPMIREIVKGQWINCTDVELESLVTSPYHEVRLAGLFVIVMRYKLAKKYKHEHIQERAVNKYLEVIDHINNWDLVDLTCYEILGDWLYSRLRDQLYEMAGSENTIWKRRIAIVTTLAFIRNGDFADTFRIANILLNDQHDLIQKAVGWMLREVGKRDCKALKSFLANRYRQMPRTMLRYAIEKFPEAERQKYLKGKE